MPDLPFLDSFDHYLTADEGQKWTSIGGLTIGAGTGRRGTNGAVLQGAGAYKTFDSEYATLYVGGAVLGAGPTIFTIYNQLSLVTISLASVGDGRLKVVGNDPTGGGNFLIGATLPILSSAWHYLEMKATVSAAGVSVEVHINENVVLTGSFAYNNPNILITFGHAAWSTFQILGQGGGASTYMDDIYVTNSGFYGDVNIDVIRPNGAGTSTMWIPNPNVANWNNVKDITPDGDTTTVSSANVNDLDLYTMQTISATAVVKAIQGLVSCKKDTAGLAALKMQYDAPGVILSSEFYPSENAYAYIRDGREDITSPSVINAILFGQIRTK